jgi:hypothetical protein
MINQDPINSMFVSFFRRSLKSPALGASSSNHPFVSEPRTARSQNANRTPTCSRRIALAVRMTPNVVDVAPDGTDAPG